MKPALKMTATSVLSKKAGISVIQLAASAPVSQSVVRNLSGNSFIL